MGRMDGLQGRSPSSLLRSQWPGLLRHLRGVGCPGSLPRAMPQPLPVTWWRQVGRGGRHQADQPGILTEAVAQAKAFVHLPVMLESPRGSWGWGWGQALGRAPGDAGQGRQGTVWNLDLVTRRSDRKHGRKGGLCMKTESSLSASFSLGEL